MGNRVRITSFSLIGFGCFAFFSLFAFGSLLWSDRYVISGAGMDVDMQFHAWRSFAFQRLATTGQVPLWDPYTFGGVPVLGNLQHAVLYPLNWLHLILPVNLAINWIVAIHVALAGLFTCAWCRFRGAGKVASLLGGTVFMFSGPYASHVYAGHLTYLCVVAWAPLLMLCVDAIIERRQLPIACIGGAAVVSMQILGGYPQPVFYLFLAVLIYAGIRIAAAPRPHVSISAILAMYFFAALLAAAQLLPAMDVAGESLRNRVAGFEFASSVSLPLENLFTLIVPNLFGDNFNSPYLGQWVMWETTLFVGVAGFVVAVAGIAAARSLRDRSMLIVLLLSLVLALGSNLPFFRLAYDIVPGLDHFRVPARFSFIAVLFIAAFAADGFDRLWNSRRLLASGSMLCAIATLMLAAAALIVWRSREQGIDGAWGSVLSHLATKNQQTWASNLSGVPLDSAVVSDSANLAANQLAFAAGAMAQVAIVLAVSLRWRRCVYLLALLVAGQIWWGTQIFWQKSQPLERMPQGWRQTVDLLGPGQRILPRDDRTYTLPTKLAIPSAWGYDPATLARWAEVVAPLVGADPRVGDFGIRKVDDSPIWSMLRVPRTMLPNERIIADRPLPQSLLIGAYSVVPSPALSLHAVQDRGFDPWKSVILESPPVPAPDLSIDGPIGEVRIVTSTEESMEIQASLSRNSLLLVTDAYSKGWRVRSIGTSPQDAYVVLPANHALRAIPLAAGQHHFVLEYKPASVTAGKVITLIAGFCWLAMLGIAIKKRVPASSAVGSS